MPLFNGQHQNDRGIRWRGIAATAMVELLVLFALSFAVIRYVEWSSAVNQAEFMMRSERVELLTPSGSPARIHSRTSYSNATPSGSFSSNHVSAASAFANTLRWSTSPTCLLVLT